VGFVQEIACPATAAGIVAATVSFAQKPAVAVRRSSCRWQVNIGAPANHNLTITQTSPTGIINWAGFSIGSGASVQFNNGSGATLNRVIGNLPSTIDGSLKATGSLYLINPAGVTVGPTGRVATGGDFYASTHNVPDANFLARGSMTFSGGSTAAVLNYGRIGSLGVTLR